MTPLPQGSTPFLCLGPQVLFATSVSNSCTPTFLITRRFEPPTSVYRDCFLNTFICIKLLKRSSLSIEMIWARGATSQSRGTRACAPSSHDRVATNFQQHFYQYSLSGGRLLSMQAWSDSWIPDNISVVNTNLSSISITTPFNPY